MKVATITALVNALVLALCLKGLHYFHLIKWHPIGFYKNGIGLKKAPNYFNGPFYFSTIYYRLIFIHDYALCIYHPGCLFFPFIRSFGDHHIGVDCFRFAITTYVF